MSTATLERAAIDAARRQLYVGGEWRGGRDGGTLPVEDPSTGEILCEVADAMPGDAKAALDAEAEAQSSRGGPRHDSVRTSSAAPSGDVLPGG